jgi:hypothetical protein
MPLSFRATPAGSLLAFGTSPRGSSHHAVPRENGEAILFGCLKRQFCLVFVMPKAVLPCFCGVLAGEQEVRAILDFSFSDGSYNPYLVV